MKKIINQNKKNTIIIISGIVFIIVAIIGFVVFQNQPKSIINSVEVKFTGYDKKGTADLDGNYNQELEAVIAKKVGYSNSDVEAVKKGNDDVLLADTNKYMQFDKYYSDTDVSLDKSDHLSNNQKIKLTVHTTLKDNPIKSEVKSINVSGLKKSEEYTVEEVLKENAVKIEGYNHFGTVNYDDKIFSLEDDDSSKELSNGDTVKLKLSDHYITEQEDKGKILEGKDTVEVKVDKLETSPKISNLSELLAQNDTVVRADKESDIFGKYTVVRKNTYFIGKNIATIGLGSAVDNGFSIVSIYQVSGDNEYEGKKTRYFIYGYSGLEMKGDKVNVSSLKDYNKYKDYDSFDSESSALDKLKSRFPSIVEMK